MTGTALNPEGAPRIKPGRGGRRPGAGRPRKAIEKTPCPACGQGDSLVEVVGPSMVCNCGGAVDLAQRLADALGLHLAARPDTTIETVVGSTRILLRAAKAALP